MNLFWVLEIYLTETKRHVEMSLTSLEWELQKMWDEGLQRLPLGAQLFI